MALHKAKQIIDLRYLTIPMYETFTNKNIVKLPKTEKSQPKRIQSDSMNE